METRLDSQCTLCEILTVLYVKFSVHFMWNSNVRCEPVQLCKEPSFNLVEAAHVYWATLQLPNFWTSISDIKMAGIDPGGVVDAILSSDELWNKQFRAVAASERSTPPATPQNRSRNETVADEVSAIFRGSTYSTTSTPTTPVTLSHVSVVDRSNFGGPSQTESQSWPIFQMQRNYAAAGAKK